MQAVTQDTKTLVQRLDIKNQKRQLLDWLTPTDPTMNYHRARQKRQEGTGAWFLESSYYAHWRAEPKSFAWLNGIPGCGKTILVSSIIKHLEQTTLAKPLVYFFF